MRQIIPLFFQNAMSLSFPKMIRSDKLSSASVIYWGTHLCFRVMMAKGLTTPQFGLNTGYKFFDALGINLKLQRLMQFIYERGALRMTVF